MIDYLSAIELRHRHGSTLPDALTLIWERLFHRLEIGQEDNFFDLGGSPSLAIQLSAEIREVLGREVSPLAIYQAPNIVALSALLSQPRAPEYSPLLLLRNGAGRPPIFVIHGLGGSVMELFHLTKGIHAEHPVYGIQEKGLDGISRPLETVEDMALNYLGAVERLQSDGPYLLIGHSFGGLVAFEMARRLSNKGKRVGLLAMLDTYPHARFLSSGQRINLWTKRAIRRLSSRQFNAGPQFVRHPASPATQRVRQCTYSALRKYEPQSYDGTINFVRAAFQTNFPDPLKYWPRLATEFELDIVPGDHLAMLSTHASSLASILNLHLKNALRN